MPIPTSNPNTIIQLAPGQSYTVIAAGKANVQITRFFSRLLRDVPPFLAEPGGFDLAIVDSPANRFPMLISAAPDANIAVSVSETLRFQNPNGFWVTSFRKTAGTPLFFTKFLCGRIGEVAFSATDAIGTDSAAAPPYMSARDDNFTGFVGVGPHAGTLTNPTPGGPSMITAFPVSTPPNFYMPSVFVGRRSVVVKLNSIPIGMDDGIGGIQPIPGSSNPVNGTLTYDGGAFSLTFQNALIAADVIGFDYFFRTPIVEIGWVAP